MITEKALERFQYDSGELDELKNKAMVACSFLMSVKGWENRAKEICNDVLRSDDEQDVRESLKNAINALLKNAPDNPGDWANLYGALFENSIYVLENHYTPTDGEDMVETVKKCIREKKRIRTDLPDGAIA